MSAALRARGRPPVICAHACQVEGGPSNTLAGLRVLAAAGVPMVEIDVRRSGDGTLVAHHDERLPDRRLVRRVSAQEVAAAYPESARPARLDELVAAAAAGGGLRLLLDLKEDGVEEEAVALALGQAAPSDVIVATLSARQVARVKAMGTDVRVGLSLNRSPGSFLRGVARARRCGADLLSVHHTHLRTQLPVRAAAAGFPLYVWTVDDDVQLERLVDDQRLAGVITSRPLRARQITSFV